MGVYVLKSVLTKHNSYLDLFNIRPIRSLNTGSHQEVTLMTLIRDDDGMVTT